MKKIFLFLVLVSLTFLLMYSIGFITFHYFETKSFKEQLVELGVYQFEENEKVIKNFTNGKRNYAISMIPYRRTNDLNIFLKYKKKYYLLKNIPSCKVQEKYKNIYIMDNKVYLHCEGATSVIMEYQVTEGFIGEKEYVFNYDKVPNSDTHKLVVSKIDEDFMYLKTSRIDENDPEGEKIRCSFKSKKCRYNGKVKIEKDEEKKEENEEKKETSEKKD